MKRHEFLSYAADHILHLLKPEDRTAQDRTEALWIAHCFLQYVEKEKIPHVTRQDAENMVEAGFLRQKWRKNI